MSIPCLLVGAAVNKLDVDTDDERVAAATAIAMMVGCLCFLMGSFKLGFLVRFIANPVLSGFASAAATITMVSVSKDIFRIKMAKSTAIYEALPRLLSALKDTHAFSTAVGVLSFLLIVGIKFAGKTKKYSKLKRVPGALVCMALALIGSFAFCSASGEDERLTVDAKFSCSGMYILGDIPSSLPSPQLPDVSFSTLGALATDACMITFVVRRRSCSSLFLVLFLSLSLSLSLLCNKISTLSAFFPKPWLPPLSHLALLSSSLLRPALSSPFRRSSSPSRWQRCTP